MSNNEKKSERRVIGVETDHTGSIEQSPRYISRLTKDTFALVLAGGRGSRLYELTNWRAKPALYFGGKYRKVCTIFTTLFVTTLF